MKKLFLITVLIITASFITVSAQYTKLLDFAGATNGINPQGALYSDGVYLYGMTAGGGNYNQGTIFKIMPDGSGYSTLRDFDWAGQNDGKGASGSLISDGTFLYGMTPSGGSHNQGTIFKIMPDGTTYSKLFDFHSTVSVSGVPWGHLIFDGVYLYGITSEGGLNNKGGIFKIMTDGTGFSKIFDFDGVNGHPVWPGSLILQGGYLYGLTYRGGTCTNFVGGCGVIFKIMTDGTGYVNLLDFDGTGNGENPIFGSFYSDGIFLYATTYIGGANGGGVIFKIMPDGSNYTKLLDFGGIPCLGFHPYGAPLISDGTYLYGTTLHGGTNNMGVLYRIMPDGTGYTQLLNFAGVTNGSYPLGAVILQGGFLYGMTTEGGTNNMGTIFKYQLGTNAAVDGVWYADADGDGFGTGSAIVNCIQPVNTSAINGDCNDGNNAVHPGATEVCTNSIDDDCDGVINDGCCAMTVSTGNDESTLFGYSGDQSLIRGVTITGGTAPFSYSWTIGRALKCNTVTAAGDEIFSGGTCVNTTCPTTGTLTDTATCSGSATVTVRVMDTTNVCVTVTDANGCVATDCFLVMAQDVRCFSGGSNNTKVKVCHQTGSDNNPWVQICVADNALPAHLANNAGDYVGTCAAREALIAEDIFEWQVDVFPNPTRGILNLTYHSPSDENINIQLTDVTGRIMFTDQAEVNTGESSIKLDLGTIVTGLYNLRVSTNSGIQNISIVLQ